MQGPCSAVCLCIKYINLACSIFFHRQHNKNSLLFDRIQPSAHRSSSYTLSSGGRACLIQAGDTDPSSIGRCTSPPPCHLSTHASSSSPIRSSFSDVMLVRNTRRLVTIGDRAFPVAAAKLWNGLFGDITANRSLTVFVFRLKAPMFLHPFPHFALLLPVCYCKRFRIFRQIK